MTPHADYTGDYTVTIAPDIVNQRLDRALSLAFAAGRDATTPVLSRSRIKALIEAGRVTCGERIVSDPAQRVKPGQVFTLHVPAAAPAAPAAQALPLDVVYEDDQVIVVDKSPGLVVHPAPGSPDRTLVNALIAHCGASLSGIGGVLRPGIVHRLDKDTSGLIIAAKTDIAHRSLTGQFAARTVERVYAALVWGRPRTPTGEISGAIGRSRGDRKKMTVVARGGKAALTRYTVIADFAGGAISLLECRLATGRTHQIRVHLAAAGHPLVGDPLYGRPSHRRKALPPVAAAAVAAFNRQALDAFVLAFIHPTSGKRLSFMKKYSNDIKLLISKLENI